MRRSFPFVATVVLAAIPSVASAAVQVNISEPTIETVGADNVFTFEVFATDLDGSDERLNAYTIALDLSGFQGGGVRFAVPSGSSFGLGGRPTVHPFVFKDMDTIPPVENFASTPMRLQVGVATIGQEDEVNIDPTHNGLFRFSVLYPTNAPRPSTRS